MGNLSHDPQSLEDEDRRLEELPEHPVGTLAIVLIFGLLFALGWLVLYYGVFLPRGATTL